MASLLKVRDFFAVERDPQSVCPEFLITDFTDETEYVADFLLSPVDPFNPRSQTRNQDGLKEDKDCSTDQSRKRGSSKRSVSFRCASSEVRNFSRVL